MKKLLNKKIITILLSIVIVITILINSTYSLLVRTDETDEQSYATGILEITSEATNNSVTLTNSLPIEDSSVESLTPYTFKITNTGNLNYTFDVKLLSTTTNNQIESQYIKIKVDDNDITSLNTLTNGKILENVTLAPKASIDINLKVWLDVNTPNSQIGKEFTAKIVTEGYADYTQSSELATTLVMNLAETDTTACAEGGTGVCKIEHTLADGTTAIDYRYRGGDPNNYVSFNNDLYRIIGVFDKNTHGKDEYLIKLIMADKLYAGSRGNYSTLANQTAGTYSYYSNDWTGNKVTTSTTDNTSPANANILLNQYFYNKKSTMEGYGACTNWTYYYYGNDDYKTFSCADIVGHGLDDTYRNYVENVTWNLRGYTTYSYTKQNFYLCERGQATTDTAKCMSGNSGKYDAITTGNIGLMYVSDYMYASSYKSSTDTTLTGSSYYFGNKNWLYKGFEWTMTPDADSADYAFIVNYNGRVSPVDAYLGYGVRPTFYLKSSVYINGGEGTIEKPYTLSLK